MAQKKSNKKNSTLLTTAVVALGVIIIIIVFLVKKDQIYSNLKSTDFFGKVFGSTPEFVEKHEPAPEKKKETIPLKDEEITIQVAPSKPVETKPEEKQEQKPDAKPQETVVAETKKEEPKQEEKKVAMTELQLCFVVIDADGSVNRKMVKRSVPKNDSPLGTALGLLMQGPNPSNAAEKECMSLIPEGTKLLSARVKDGVAYLSFNENFEINSYGVEGYIGQLMQIVYTATAFSTVNSVQFLIEGEKRDYLGSEGQWIGSPLSRSSF